jgi:hypothetical protein
MRAFPFLLAADTLYAQSSDDILFRARRNLLDALHHLPNYTCVQP